MFSVTPSGLAPVSNRNRCSRPALVTVTSAEKPCSATSASGTWPPVIVVVGRHGPLPIRTRRAGPRSGSSMSVTLSISVVMTTESTGSRSIRTAGSTSWRRVGTGPAGLSSRHMAQRCRGICTCMPSRYTCSMVEKAASLPLATTAQRRPRGATPDRTSASLPDGT